MSPDLTLIATARKPNVFTIGDINGLALLDSVAFAQARVAVENYSRKSAGFNLRWVPRCVHTDPPVASAGWTEKEAIAAGHNIEVLGETIRLVTDDDRSVVDSEPIKNQAVVKPETTRALSSPSRFLPFQSNNARYALRKRLGNALR